jgi:hypothetical protein
VHYGSHKSILVYKGIIECSSVILVLDFTLSFEIKINEEEVQTRRWSNL